MNWISTKDRLPDDTKEYLCYTTKCKIKIAKYLPAFNHWQRHTVINNVTHWMPLPEPPETK